jgi:hypothetical protein
MVAKAPVLEDFSVEEQVDKQFTNTKGEDGYSA